MTPSSPSKRLNKKEATALYLRRGNKSHIIIKRLMDWNPRLTVRQNSDKLGLDYYSLIVFKDRFGLKSAPDYESTRNRKIFPKDIPVIHKMRELGETYHKIAARYGVSKQRIFEIVNAKVKR